MIGEIKKVELGGKTFEIQKQGVTGSLEIQSIFMEIMAKADIPEDMDDSNPKMGMLMMKALRGPLLTDMKAVIIKSVFAPKMTPDSYESLSPSIIPNLFMAIYHFNVGDAEDKKKEPNES
ncbi:hypothetical protein KKI24_14345 [bacterium]|nr:hypothetical protein [bacterium]